jgi:hypothetical protein
MDRPVKILVATPVAGGVVTHDYLHGIAAFLARCAELRWSAVHVTQPDGLVTRSRNSFASLVVRDPSFTHLLMLDADVVVSAEGLERLVRSGHHVAGCCVPLRNVNWDRAKQMSAGRPLVPVESLRLVATEYAVWFDDEPGIPVDGFAPVQAVGSAAMLITREALVRLTQSDLVRRVVTGMPAADLREDGWTFFDTLVDEHGTYLSEDYAFCQRWRSLGGQIMADLRTPTRHVGPVIIDGDIAGSLAAAAELAGTPKGTSSADA